MQLLYSGAASDGAAQLEPNQSLGGFISSSPISNASLNNLFPSISKKHITNNIQDTRLIVLKNVSGIDFKNLRIWTLSGDLATYKVAVVSPALKDHVYFFEKMTDGTGLPLMATLMPTEGESNAIACGEFNADAILGIWIQRTVKNTLLDVAKIVSGDVDEIAKLQIAAPLSDEMGLVIDFTT